MKCTLNARSGKCQCRLWVDFDSSGHTDLLYGILFYTLQIRGFANKTKFQKFEFTMEVGGWVQVSRLSLGIFFLENHPKIALK